MTASRFSPVVDIIKASGGMLRVSSGIGAGTPAIMLEVFANADDTATSKGKVTISADMIPNVVMALADASCRAVAIGAGKAKAARWAVVNADIVEALNGGRAHG